MDESVKAGIPHASEADSKVHARRESKKDDGNHFSNKNNKKGTIT